MLEPDVAKAFVNSAAVLVILIATSTDFITLRASLILYTALAVVLAPLLMGCRS
jgi:hypothetical protein